VDQENSFFAGVMDVAMSTVPKFVNRNKSLILKVTPDIVQYLSKVFSSTLMEALDGKELLHQKIIAPDTIATLLALVQSLQEGCKIIGQGLNPAGKPYKPLNEELLIYKFLQSLNDVCKSSRQSHKIYLEYLLDSLQYRGSAHSESQVRKHLQILSAAIM